MPFKPFITRHKRSATAALAAGALVLVSVRSAQAGFPVFDLENWIQQTITTSKIGQEIVIAQNVLKNGLKMYSAEQYMQTRLTQIQKMSMSTVAHTLAGNQTPNQGGETAGWRAVLNGAGGMSQSAWSTSTVQLSTGALTALAGKMPGQSKDMASLAFVEQVDGAGVQCLDNLATYQKNAGLNQPAIQSWNRTAQDGTASTGSLIQGLGVQAMGQGQANNELRAQGSIQTCEAQQTMLANKLRRDEMAHSMNYAAELQTTLGQSSWNGQTATNQVIP